MLIFSIFLLLFFVFYLLLLGMDIHKRLDSFKQRLDAEIGEYLDEAIHNVKKEDIFLSELLKRTKRFVLAGGKRLRGALLYCAYRANGGDDEKKILRVCAGIELVHAFFLVHDDIMDRDEMRHGKITLHRDFAKVGRFSFPHGDSDHFGISMAIVAGDLLASAGGQCLFSSGFPAERVIVALRRLQESISRTGLGQAMDIAMEYGKKATESQVLSMYENKTARYTFESPMHIGGILAGASDKILHQYSEYALSLGVAFQLQDDMLGVYGNEKKTGKSNGSDIAEGKMTLLAVKAEELGTRSEKRELRNLLGKQGITEHEIQRVREIFERSGSVEYVREKTAHFLEKGIAFARQFSALGRNEFSHFFVQLGEYLKEREV